MKALSLKRPWPWAVLYLGKDVENRVWCTRYRGPLLIQAAATPLSKAYYDWSKEKIYQACGPSDFPSWKDMPGGGIVGRCTLVDVLEPEKVDSGWHMARQFGFVLRNVQRIAGGGIIPYKGSLGLFEVSDKVIADVQWEDAA